MPEGPRRRKSDRTFSTIVAILFIILACIFICWSMYQIIAPLYFMGL